MKRALNKHRLNQLQQDLELYQRFLPALDLKRQQLMARQKAIQEKTKETEALLQNSMATLLENFPWLLSQRVNINDVIKIEETGYEEKKVMGVKMLVLSETSTTVFSEFKESLTQSIGSPNEDPVVKHYRPYWLPTLYQALKPLLTLKLELWVLTENLQRLKQATKKATQKVNLFSKVMIPDTEKEMRQIKLFLGDQEKAAVIRAKLAKSKQQQKQIH